MWMGPIEDYIGRGVNTYRESSVTIGAIAKI